MFTGESCEHFEDWYIAYRESSGFQSFDDAIRYFTEICIDDVIDDVASGSGIDNYIAENHRDEIENDSKWVREYSTGFWFVIESDDIPVLSLHLDYIPETHSIYCDADVEIDEEHLTSIEILKVQNSLVKIREALSLRFRIRS